MASIPGARFDISGASGSQGLLAPKSSWKAYFLPRGAYAAQDSTGTRITFDSAATASRFTVGDWIQAGLLTSNIRQVGAVGGTSITVSGAALTVAENDRIFLIGRTEPTVSGGSATYSTPNTIIRQRDDDAATLYTNSMVTTNANGLVQAFGTPALYDLLVQDGNRSLQGSLVDLPIGVPEGVSVSDDAYFGGSVTVYGTLSAKKGPWGIVSPDLLTSGSSTAGIQEAIELACSATGSGAVALTTGKTYSITTPVRLHGDLTIYWNGATVIRAAGSISDSDATYSGAMFLTSPFGSTALPTSSTSLRNIRLLGPGTIDGNSTAFMSLTNTNLYAVGVKLDFVDGPLVSGLDFKNTIMDGLQFADCRSIRCSDLLFDKVGVWGVTATRNAISLNNLNNATGWCRDVVMSNLTMRDVGDEAIGGSMQYSNVNVNGLNVDGCDIIFEIGCNYGTSISHWNCSNVTATGVRSALVSLQANTSGANLHDMTFSNFMVQGDTTLHDGFCITSGFLGNMERLHFDELHVTNVNSSRASAARWLNFQPCLGGTTASRISFSNCSFAGVRGRTEITDIGLLLRGNISAFRANNVDFFDVPGAGIAIDDSNDSSQSGTVDDVEFDGVRVMGSNYIGTQIIIDGGASIYKNIRWRNSKMVDCCRQGGGSAEGWRLGIAFSGATCQRITWDGCESYLTGSSQHKYGIRFFHSAGTLDDMTVTNSDFRGVSIMGINIQGGTVTNLFYRPKPGQGSSISTSATIAIPQDGEVFQVFGSTAITGVSWNQWDNGRVVKLVFVNGGTVSSPLANAKIAGTFSVTANYSMTLRGTSSSWNEDCRSANA